MFNLKTMTDGKNNLAAGNSLGHYRILKPLGAGGMGEVYLAEDTRLGQRRVALKLLSESATGNTDRLRRFEQEASAASRLNHPNIAHIYEIGEAEGIHFIAMEYVEGESLSDKIRSLTLSISEITSIGAQIADALEEAHAQRITHRDVKSDNVMLDRRGRVKVLDFGLAKMSQRAESPDSKATTQVKTNPGVVMGTVAYMSPEQALGRETDARTDIWSLGVVLYEMATGKLPFTGNSITETIQQITHAQPEAIARFNYDVPPELEVIIKKALRKKREERYQTARDIRIDLNNLKRELELTEHSIVPEQGGDRKISTGSEQRTQSFTKKQIVETNETAPIHAPSSAEYIAAEIKRHKTGAFAVSVLLLLALGGLGYGLYRLLQTRAAPPPLAAQTNKTAPALKAQRLTGNGKAIRAAISPDGKFLAYVQNEGGQQSLWVKQISTNSSVQVIAPTLIEKYTFLAFTPDGDYIYFTGRNKENPVNTIFRVPTFGSSFSKIISDAYGISFSPDGRQFAFGRWDVKTAETAVMVANADGTNERKLASLSGTRYFSEALAWSPDGKLIACGVADDEKPERKQTLAVLEVLDGAMKELSEYEWDDIDSTAWLPDMSAIIFSADDTGGGEGVSKLFEISYPGGESRRLTSDLTHYSRLTITADGKTIVAIENEWTSGVWVSPNADVNRAAQVTTGKDKVARGIAWTPDKRIVYVSTASGNTEVWIMNADGANQKQLTNDARIKYTPVVSSDGHYIVYATSQGGGDLWRIRLDGSSPTVLTGKGADEANPDISPDGKWIVYSAWTSGKQALWRMPIEGGEAKQLTDFESTEPQVSQDGKFIACFFIDEKNISHIAVISFEGGAPIETFDVPKTVYTDMSPKWTPDGRGITFIDNRGGSRNLWVQPMVGGAAKQLTDFKQNGIYRREWTRDGKQAAIVRGEESNDAVMITDFR